MNGLDRQTLEQLLAALRKYSQRKLPFETLLKLDQADEFPRAILHDLYNPDVLGLHLLFIPEEFGGLGGGVYDIYRVAEQMGAIDLGIATGVLATFLGSDPLKVGGAPSQKELWLGRLADEALLMAYGATEPQAGSDLAALSTRAEPVRDEQNGQVIGYRLNGRKQWISNGGVADLYAILALAPGGPSWFVVEKDRPGFTHGKAEDKHGIRASNTAALFLDDVFVPADHLIGEVEGQGLTQAQAVFGYTRLMVGAFGLGAGWEALRIAIRYAQTRIQAGGPLSKKQGYTHKLIVPNAAWLEAARAYIEWVARRLDGGEQGLATEGAIAKYMATEAGNRAAEDAIQALGGYGYTREYRVEKIKRDVRITTIYEGTSEIMEWTAARDRWQEHLKTRGAFYQDWAGRLELKHAAQPENGLSSAAAGLRALAAILERARLNRLTRNQHILFRLGELIAWGETAAVFSEGVLDCPSEASGLPIPTRQALARIFARQASFKIATQGIQWVISAEANYQNAIKTQASVQAEGMGLASNSTPARGPGGGLPDGPVLSTQELAWLQDVLVLQAGLLADMDLAADSLIQAFPA